MPELYEAVPYLGAHHRVTIENDTIVKIESYRPIPPEQQTDRLWAQGWRRIFLALSAEDIRRGMYDFVLVETV